MSDEEQRMGPAELIAAWLDDLREYPDLRAVTDDQLAASLIHLLSDNGMRVVAEVGLCERVDPVLARYGIPLHGLPLSRAAATGNTVAAGLTYRANGQGDRGDLTSDIMTAVLTDG